MRASTFSLLGAALYWDGTWSTGSNLRSVSEIPSAGQAVRTDGSDADFITSGTSAVTVLGTVDVNSFTFPARATPYTIAGIALTLTLSGTNTYNGGTLSAEAAPTIGPTAGDVANSSTLVFNRSDALISRKKSHYVNPESNACSVSRLSNALNALSHEHSSVSRLLKLWCNC